MAGATPRRSADFNGKCDILFQNIDGAVALWLIDGTSATSQAVVQSVYPSWHVIGTGDFDGDGNSDILFQHTNGSIAIWLMNGTSPTAETFVQTVDPSWRAIGSYD